ncbi:GNAT family N-acetyltransferase [Streptomyces sp. NPDC093111]|uniref:GNAT family N-acetyltransferase n=1 Tax=Streptomyces sp. NPDC093111 TaxID=3154978 RepID=UPI00342BDDB6
MGTLWRSGASGPPAVPDACGGGHHVLRTGRLLLRTPRDVLDMNIGLAVSSDAEAQRWLGWRAEFVHDGPVAEALLGIAEDRRDEVLRALGFRMRRELRRPFVPAGELPRLPLIAFQVDSGRVAGMSSVELDTRTIGLQIAPTYRGHGLGSELARATALFAHTHLGVDIVRAGTETSNSRCRRALGAAGFLPCDGPARHTLPDRRVIEAVWYQHGASDASTCGG